MSKTIGLFPGQGSQYIGMGQKLAAELPAARELQGRADEILGIPLSRIMAEGPEEEIKATQNTQPALFVTSMMVMELVRAQGVSLDFVAGHSLGEYSAICAAGGFSFEEGLKLVRVRGELMAKAGELKPGAMSAVLGLEDSVLEAVLAEASATGVVVAANFNSPGQVVISGSREGVAKAGEIASARGAKKVVPLPVSGAFHSPLMEYALPGLQAAVAQTTFKDLQIPLVANVTADLVTSGAQVRELLVRQLVSPVRWQASMEKALSAGMTRGVEIGAGKVLMGLMRNINRDAKVFPVESVESIQAVLA
jgi:[acyl-carrier-protein] S-malonyltransferase